MTEFDDARRKQILTTIKQNEIELFHRHEKEHGKLVRDGVVDEVRYRDSRPKLLFLLKEVNHPNAPEDWDLRDYVEDDPRSYTWDNVARWVLGLRNLDEDICWIRVQERMKNERIDLLRSIVVMNVKKEPGGAAAHKGELVRWANSHRELLQEQFLFYKPDLVICCGYDVSDAAKAAGIIKPGSGTQTKRGVWYTKIMENTSWITFYHPQARYPHHLMYYGLIDAAREVLLQKSF
jgi:hypothetical protein